MEFVNPFLIGGSVIAGSKIVARLAGPSLAPIVGGMPTGIIASFFLKAQQAKREYFAGYFYSSILLAIAIMFIHIVSMTHKNWNVDIISGVALALWAILSYVAIKHFIPKKK